MNKIVILAAGKGKRMKSELPKVLVPIKGKAMLWHLVNSVINSGVDSEPVIVASPDNIELIKETLKDFSCHYALQDKQLGTGHAFKCALEKIPDDTKYVICLYGDHPFISSQTIKKIKDMEEGKLSLITLKVPDFEDWRQSMFHWGRIVRDEKGEVKEIVEYKDASDETRKVRELNPALFRFDCAWAKKHIEKLRNQNAQNEYYLTDLVNMAFAENIKIPTINIKPEEGIGINSKEELKLAEKILGD